MDVLKSVIDFVYKYVWEIPAALPYIVVLLIGTGIFLTIRMRFIQLRKVGHSLAVIAGYYDNPKDAGEINHFQALSAALSATIGIGNIPGVATAIHYGGGRRSAVRPQTSSNAHSRSRTGRSKRTA